MERKVDKDRLVLLDNLVYLDHKDQKEFKEKA